MSDQSPRTRAEYMRSYVRDWRQRRRVQLIELLGGKCVRCGSTNDLEFDHIDPETKRFAVGSDMSKSAEPPMPVRAQRSASDEPAV